MRNILQQIISNWSSLIVKVLLTQMNIKFTERNDICCHTCTHRRYLISKKDYTELKIELFHIYFTEIWSFISDILNFFCFIIQRFIPQKWRKSRRAISKIAFQTKMHLLKKISEKTWGESLLKNFVIIVRKRWSKRTSDIPKRLFKNLKGSICYFERHLLK